MQPDLNPSIDADEAVAFLKTAEAHGVQAGEVHWIETHMSWVFIVRDQVLKLKKPVGTRYFDHTTPARREHDCREELRLNARLAPGVYLGLSVLARTAEGLRLLDERSIPAGAEAIDWLVHMRRLPDDAQLDRRIRQQQVDAVAVDALAGLLARFYATAPPSMVAPADHVARFGDEQRINRELLLNPQWSLRDAAPTLAAFDARLAQQSAALAARAAQGHLVEGHGDLRPEHVFLLEPPVIIDCLEFSAALRRVDPFDEVGFLGMECELAGAGWIGPRLHASLVDAGCPPPTPALSQLYRASRALLRARLAIAHLLDAQPRDPAKWPMLADRYLELARSALTAPPVSTTG